MGFLDTPPSSTPSLTTPLNILLLLVVVAAVAYHLAPPAPLTLPKSPPPTLFRTFTPKTLLPFSGHGANGVADEDTPVYLAIRGRVFDVSRGRGFYGPGGPYATFAGRDASRGLACQSFDPSMLTADLDGPLDPLDDLGREELENLANWEEMFTDKYLVVGRLMAEGDLDKVDGPGSKERR